MSDDSNVIRADIADTRERLSNTIGAIGERLNPQTLKDNVKDSIREATIGRVSTMAQHAVDKVGRTTDGIGSTIRDNPLPAAMVAIGLGWIMWNARTPSSSAPAPRMRGATDMGYGPDYGQGYGQAIGERAEWPTTDTDTVRERAQQVAGSVKDKAQHAYGTASDVTRRSAVRVEDAFQQNPLVIGAVAMAIGLAAGLTVPVTDREVRLMGDAHDDLAGRVKDMADETRTKAEHVVSRVAQEARTAARDEGLIVGEPFRPTA